MYQEKFEIIINTDKKLNINDLIEIRRSIFYRLQGYSTECPKSLKNSDMELKYINIRKLKLKNISK